MLWWLALCVTLACGCSGNQVVEEPIVVAEPAGPANLTEAVDHLREHCGTIKAAFDAGTPHECDSALHQAAKVVQQLGTLAGEQGRSAETIESINAEGKKLFEQFMLIHEGFHGDGELGHSYEDVEEPINSALAALQATVDAPVETEVPAEAQSEAPAEAPAE